MAGRALLEAKDGSYLGVHLYRPCGVRGRTDLKVRP